MSIHFHCVLHAKRGGGGGPDSIKIVYVLNGRPRIRGDVKIHWLQPPYSAASHSQFIKEKLYTAVECCSILAAAIS